MRRLVATIITDVRVQFRNGFYFATALVVIFSIALLRWLPTEVASLFLPVVIIQNVLMNAFYFVAGLLLLERVEGTFTAVGVTPLRLDEYVASKVITLTGLSLAEGLLIVVAVYGVHPGLVAMALGIVLAALLFCLVGAALVVRYDSINEYLLPSVVYTFILTLPILGYFGVGAPAWYLAHPVQGPLMLMQLDAPRSAAWLVYAIGCPLLWTVPVYLWSRRSLRRVRTT